MCSLGHSGLPLLWGCSEARRHRHRHHTLARLTNHLLHHHHPCVCVVGVVGEAVATVCVEVAVMVWCVLTGSPPPAPAMGHLCRPITTSTVTTHSPTAPTTTSTTTTHVCVWWVWWVRRW